MSDCLSCGEEGDNWHEVPGSKIMKNGGPACRWAYFVLCDECYGRIRLHEFGYFIDKHPERLKYVDTRMDIDRLTD